MKYSVKTQKQVEFAEAVQTLEDAGWSRTQIAKALMRSPAAVSLILSGTNNPSAITLDKIKELASRATAKPAPKELQPDANLAFLKEHAPADYKAAELMLNALTKQAMLGVNSGRVEEEAGKIVDAAMDALSVGELEVPVSGEPATPAGQPKRTARRRTNRVRVPKHRDPKLSS